MLGSTAAINAALLGSVMLAPVGANVASAQVQTSSPQNNANVLPAVTVDQPGAARKRTAASSQNTRSSRAVAASRRSRVAAPAQSQAPRPEGAAGAVGVTTGYVATGSTAGTKTDTALIETPQSLSVVTQKELRDRNVQTLKDAVNYTPGVTTTAFGYDPRFNSFYIRGFDATYTGIYCDGLRQGGGNFAIPKIEPYGLDRVSILRRDQEHGAVRRRLRARLLQRQDRLRSSSRSQSPDDELRRPGDRDAGILDLQQAVDRRGRPLCAGSAASS
ncbi:TonB-dependent receptor plug domain-containing protein [Bradyrhizobium sp. NAS96.2]|uniref:TonB-dependent receptor plug domain-containing protein n=1 Tax=Bradyrhizobium sp. NAS96.2 TaxID=1680160 RepID=UPI001FD9EA20|nr:TonB-dependent receptor plug domain-containing protein [Bradyrhizobium sp. NAS96.2]